MTRPHTKTDIYRFFTQGNENGCWIWEGPKMKLGYGRVKFENYFWLAHRLIYTLEIGPIPKGLVLDHLCRNPCCVNPGHLEPVTQRENMQRSAPAQKRYCHNGHERLPENIEIYARNDVHGKAYKRCLICYAAKHPGTLKLKEITMANKKPIAKSPKSDGEKDMAAPGLGKNKDKLTLPKGKPIKKATKRG